MHRNLIALLVLLFALPAAAQFGPEFERILLPIAIVDTPGAYGSLWRTELWCRNDGDEPARVVPIAQSEFAFAPHSDSQLPIFLASVGFPLGSFSMCSGLPAPNCDSTCASRTFPEKNRLGVRRYWWFGRMSS